MSEVLNVISSDEEIQELINYLQDKEFIAVDTETTSVRRDATVVGISVCAEESIGYYVITAMYDPEAKELVMVPNREQVNNLLRLLKTKQLVFQNALFDWEKIDTNYKIQLHDSTFHDVMISSHLLNENALHGLKERAKLEFGADATIEQEEMRASVLANGGRWETKKKGEKDMYMADPYLLGRYGAKDAILTLRLFHLDVIRLDEQGLSEYFYDFECMPLLKGPTRELNSIGIKVDVYQLRQLGTELRSEINDLKAAILADIQPYIKDEYPGGSKKKEFNIGSSNQLAWLFHVKLGNPWTRLTDGGKAKAKQILGKVPYSDSDKRRFEVALRQHVSPNGEPLKLQKYVECGKDAITSFTKKYTWCENLLKYAKAKKLLTTYVEGMLKVVEYGIIHPRFNQIGTRGTRYSSSTPNFQNLPRDDKRIKACMIARTGKVLVAADSSQIEARVFSSFSGDYELQQCFSRGEDFYSVVGMRVFRKTDCTPHKEGSPESFGVKYKKLRQSAKVIALAVAYGAEANLISDLLGITIAEAQQIIDDYWLAYPTLKEYCDKQEKAVVETGVVFSLFGRPRRLPEAKILSQLGWPHMERIPGEYKTFLNMARNQPIQITSGSCINRASIETYNIFKAEGIECTQVCQVHDQIVIECWEKDAKRVAEILQDRMENAVKIPGVMLEARPLIGKSLAEV